MQIVYFAIAKYSVSTLDVKPMDLSIIRTGCLAITAFTFAKYKGLNVWDLKAEVYRFVVVRAVMGAIAYGGMVYSVSNLPLMISTILINTNPFWCALLGIYMLNEQVTLYHSVCMFGCFLGVVILTLAKSADQSTVSEITGLTNIQNHFLGVSMGILCAFCSSFVFVITRKLRAVHFSLMLFHYGWIATLLFIAWAFADFKLYGTT